MMLAIGQRWKLSKPEFYYIVELTNVDHRIDGIVKGAYGTRYGNFHVGQVLEDLDIDPTGSIVQTFYWGGDGSLATWEYMIGQDAP